MIECEDSGSLGRTSGSDGELKRRVQGGEWLLWAWDWGASVPFRHPPGARRVVVCLFVCGARKGASPLLGPTMWTRVPLRPSLCLFADELTQAQTHTLSGTQLPEHSPLSDELLTCLSKTLLEEEGGTVLDPYPKNHFAAPFAHSRDPRCSPPVPHLPYLPSFTGPTQSLSGSDRECFLRQDRLDIDLASPDHSSARGRREDRRG